jgi:hypothetical protein
MQIPVLILNISASTFVTDASLAAHCGSFWQINGDGIRPLGSGG